MGGKRNTLKTSREIHDRIRWDASLDARAFVVVYEERFTGRRSRGFTEFPTDGEIPWHRVWEYRVDELVVWSREARVDLLFGSGDTGRAQLDEVRAAIERWRQRVLPGGEPSGGEDSVGSLEALETWRHDPGAGTWVTGAAGAGAPLLRPRSLVVVTLNVLFDLYDDDGSLHTERRIPALLELLRSSGADLVALQEVTPRTLRALLDAPWVQQGFVSSDGPAAATVEPYGVVLLSRLPMRAFLRRAPAGGRKRTVVAEVELAEGPLQVAVVHLTSDRKQDAAARRPRELAQVLRDLDGLGAGPRVLLGDLNADEGPLDHTLHAAGFVDLWSRLRPDEDGATFDPHANALARLASRSGRARRLDRIMLREGEGEGVSLRPLDVVRIGTVPAARDPEGRPLPVSDHFGLRARLRVEGGVVVRTEVPRFRPTHHSAVVVIPPRGVWSAIEAIRREHDPAVGRWMPHVNLLYGFAPAELHGAAGRALEAALAEVPPFRVTLERFRWFPRRGGATVWLEPRCDPSDALVRVQALLFERFPWCDEQSRKSASGFTPHLTVGRLREPEVEAKVACWQAEWSPISFEVDALALIHRGEQGPFAVQRVVAIAGPRIVTPPALPAARAGLVASLSRAWGELVEDGAHERPAPLFVAGSHRLGVAEPHADLDLVGVAPRQLSRARLLERLVAQLRAQGVAVRARLVEGAAPRLALRVAEVAVDLQPVAWPDDRPWPTSVAALSAVDDLDAESRAAVLALRNADALLEHAARHGGQERYRAALRRLRQWAAAREVDDNALGYPGGLAWAVMLADVAATVACDPTDEDPAGTLVEAAIRRLARRTADDWRSDPIALHEPSTSVGSTAPMIVLEPAEPSSAASSRGDRNCMRRATATTVRVLMAELDRAAARLERGEPWAALVSPIDPCATHPWLLVAELQAPDDDALDEREGALRGRAAGLVRAIERTLPDGHALRPCSLVRVPAEDRQRATAWLVLGLEAPSGAPPSLPTEPLRELEQAVEGVRLSVWSAAEARARMGDLRKLRT